MTRPKRILVVCRLDRFANGQKPFEIQRFLQDRGHEVRLYDTYHLSRSSRKLYAVNAAAVALTRRWKLGRRLLSFPLLLADCRIRGEVLREVLDLDAYDLVICETSSDSFVLDGSTTARTVFDCPTPWADELYYEGRLTAEQHRNLREIETRIFERVDHLAFHWQTYADYAVRHYDISGRNLLTLNFGCTPATRRAEFGKPLRLVYLGALDYGNAIDLPLLSRLSGLYPIDVYGGPPPDPELGLNYLGYAPPSVLRRYQAGVITCPKDELRSNGFSAKHLEYLAHGLPVLVPGWRNHLDLLRGSVLYDEDTFFERVAELQDESEWRRRSDEAYAQAEQLSWDRTLLPLEELLRD
jgi:glycosyltransferase involved in cell wall biosynthesis